jgi:transposase
MYRFCSVWTREVEEYSDRLLAPDSRLRQWGLELATRGGKNAKKRAVVAVARKLAVLLHRLWVTAEVYEPLRMIDHQAA